MVCAVGPVLSAPPATVAPMSPRRRPDPVTRWVSHVLVGAAAGLLVGQRSGPIGGVISALVAIAAHEELDAPVAGVLADLGL